MTPLISFRISFGQAEAGGLLFILGSAQLLESACCEFLLEGTDPNEFG